MTETQTPTQLQLIADEVPGELTPLSIIRTETVMSRLPIHMLTRHGRIDIEIKRQNAKGVAELMWEVSYNEKFGVPRQLAYKLDTIVINHRIEEAGRPTPKVIRLGSLNQICKELGITSSGANTNSVRRALYQNAGAFINARLDYRGTDGTQRTVEAGGTRYTIVFTGERLPDGRRADATYIRLNDFYWEVLNNAPTRPLDYAYLKSLPPAPQRFYEVLSYKIFAALKNKHPHAKMLYSEYCTYSAQKRHDDAECFRVQMYNVHREHIRSGYLAKAWHEPALNDDGQPDWMLYYTPGYKAKAEYNAFTRKKQAAEKPVIETTYKVRGSESAQEQPVTPKTVTRPRSKRSKQPAVIDEGLLRELTDRGISEAKAREVLAMVVPEQPVREQLAYGDEQVAKAPTGTFRNPAGFFLFLVETNFVVPKQIGSVHKDRHMSKARREQEDQEREYNKRRDAYERYRGREVKSFFEQSMTAEERESLVSSKRSEFAPYFGQRTAEDVAELIDGFVLAEVAERVRLMSFEEFCHTIQS